MNIWAEPDSGDTEIWVSIAGDDSAETESSTWKMELYVMVEGSKD
jgi:hypothetical protein